MYKCEHTNPIYYLHLYELQRMMGREKLKDRNKWRKVRRGMETCEEREESAWQNCHCLFLQWKNFARNV